MSPKDFCIPALFLCWSFGTEAQPSNASFLHYTTDQGLSNDHVTAIAKDRQGFLWIGTVNGLNRFDGRYFKIFRPDPKSENSIPEEHIYGITIAPDGWLWIATATGLCKLNPLLLNIHRIHLTDGKDTLKDEVTTKVVFDSKGMAWTTSSRGIHKINHVSGRQEDFIETHQKTIGWYGTYIDRKDRLWFLKDTIRRFDSQTKTFKLFYRGDTDQPFVNAGPFSLVEDFSGELWAGTWYNGIWKYRSDTDEFVRDPAPETFAMMLMPDTLSTGQQFLWVGGGRSGLAIYHPATNEIKEFNPDPRDPYTHNNYLAKIIFKDPSNQDVWIGTEVGLEHYAPSAVRFGRAMIPPENDMGQFSLVSGVVHDHTDPKHQRYYIAVWGTGLFEWNKLTGEFTRMRSIAHMTGGGNFNLFQDKKGYIWSCLKGGAGRYHPQTKEWKDYRNFFEDNNQNNLFWCGTEDRQGNLWFGSNKEGLFRYNPELDQMESVFYKRELADDKGNLNVVEISEDTLGRLWLACGSSSVIRFHPQTGEYAQISFPEQDIPLDCSAVEVNRNGLVYAAFYGSFVEMDMQGKLLNHFDDQSGLKTNRVMFIVEDLQGKIWFNSEYLLHCFDPEKRTFSYYGKPDGLFSNAMTDALAITPDGEIFVGFQNAFNMFYPDQLRHNTQKPPIAVTSVKVMNKERQAELHEDSMLTLKPGEDFFEIEFAALNYNQQERNRYAYLLEGFNKEWVFTDRPVATFTNLDGGDYVLRMKAANNDGLWNEEGTYMRIRVIPPFYKTLWFFLLVALSSSTLILSILWFRRQQRNKLEQFRESLARDLHDEMGSTLSSIRFFSDFANQQIGGDKPLVKPVLQRISQSASNLSESMQDIVWAMKTKHDQLEDMAAHMVEFGLNLFEARNVDFKTYISEDFSGKHLKPAVRRNVYLIYKEAVNNAAKYAEATHVELHFTAKNGLLSMKVVDNGKGFDGLNPANGNGLQNMRQRAAEIGGKLAVIPEKGSGTRIELLVKL